MRKKDESLLFVAIREPSSTRRDVLMATKDVLDILKRYEAYRVISAQKQKVLAELNQVAGSLRSLNSRLRARMPKAPISPQFSAAREKEDEFITGPAPETARPKSKLDILQEELEKIESRLGALE